MQASRRAQHAIELYEKMGGRVYRILLGPDGVQRVAVRHKDRIDLEQLRTITDRFGGIDANRPRSWVTNSSPGDAWLSQDVDILIPAALENQITPAVFPQISQSVRVLCEAANGPTTPDCDPLIQERGLLLLPDFLCNAGGVTCSYFEQVQSNMNFFWPHDEVLGRLDTTMTNAFRSVSDLAQSRNLSLRDAAYFIAVDRVARACKDRGWV